MGSRTKRLTIFTTLFAFMILFYGVLPTAAQGNATFNGRLWLDRDGDGFQDAEETGLTNITIELFDSFGDLLTSTTSDASGSYGFFDLASGDYTLRPSLSSMPGGLVQTYDADFFLDGETSTFLGVDENLSGLDFGYQGNASLDGLVFFDSDADGVQDPGEDGLGGSILTLSNSSGQTVVTTTTDLADGSYSIQGLPAGHFTVTVDPMSVPDLNPATDPDGLADHQTTVLLAAFQSLSDVHFGYNSNGSLTGRLFLDLDGDGFRGATEPGIVGTSVELLDGSGVLITTKTSGAGGIYQFTNIPFYQDFTVRVVPPVGVSQTADPDGLFNQETTINLVFGTLLTDLDFGYAGSADLSGVVFFDLDGDGFQGFDEEGIHDVTLRLTDLTSGEVASTVTDLSGTYNFSGLPANNYSLAVDTNTLPNGATAESDPDGVLDNETSLTLATGEAISDLNFGYANNGPGEIAARVWEDQDGNGIAEGSEPGLGSISITLLNQFEDTIDSKITNGNGEVVFEDLLPGEYILLLDESALPAGFTPTFDSDGLTTPHEIILSIASGESNTDSAFGYIGPGSIMARVWEDQNGDGIEDGAEPGLGNIPITLLNHFGDTVDSKIANGNGEVTFEDLLPGDYTLLVDESAIPAAFTQTFDNDGLSSPHEVSLSIAAGENNTDSRFGYIGPGSIMARVWEDQNGDGIEDGAEPGLGNIPVTLLNQFGDTIDSKLANGNGEVIFEDLFPGSYTLLVDESALPPAFTQTFDNDGLTSPNAVTLTITAGENNTDSRFGYIGPGSIMARVWEDQNGDGIEDGAEPGLGNIPVTLLNQFGDTIDSKLANGNGEVIFEDLFPGSYTLLVDESALPPAFTQTFDSDGLTSPNAVALTITAGENNTDSRFGYIGPGSIMARVWEDQNGDGIEDGAEPGLGNIPVSLLNQFGDTIDSKFTNGNGEVTFDTLFPGSYSLLVDESALPTSFTQTFDSDGLTSPHSVTLSITAGENSTGSSFGYFDLSTQTPSMALLVVLDDSQLGVGDLAVRDRLLALGYQVTLRSQSTSQSTDADGMDVVFISSTVTSNQVNSKFRDVTVPVLTWEPFLLDDMKMTGPVAHVDYGSQQNQTTINIVEPSHPLASGLSGTVQVLGSADRITWGKPNSNALTIAHFGTGESPLFGYETGASMMGMNAPARRVGFFLTDESAATLTPEGWALFEAALCWSTNCNGLPVPNFNATPTQGSAPLEVFFDATTSTSGINPIDTYSWDFGDGASAQGATLSHTYNVGTWTATLTVTDTAGLSATASTTINVGPASPTAQALLVAANTTLGASDAAIRSRLESMGYAVTVVAAQSSSAADAAGMDVVLISSTINSNQVNSKFRDVAVPVVTWEAWLYDDLKMTVGGTNVGYGRIDNQSSLEISDPSHPLAAGLSGLVSIVPNTTYLRWGAPEATAQVVAVAEGNSSRALVFGYEAGASMAGLNAPARRVGVPFADHNAENFNAQGWALFDAAVNWAVGN